ncbi:LysE family translocator [Spiractinospora alimapuensis]|uniref:LysE family translocator n=1 Tax=Spiractinospora alimapuensis TaxID=2820884 RepID=UPI001F46AC95|nr:LysE family translocator [Spiractinospora alimapuensis]QVQ50155.1 LysE family translocator [Spiractinospora alimapuensis]
MPPATNAAAFALAAVALILIPGPSVLFVIGRSLSLGRRGGLLSVLGNALGMLPAITCVALGVGTVVAESVVVFTAIKMAGAAYIIFLGVQAIRHRDTTTEADAPVERRMSSSRLLGQGFLVGVSNPKTIVFFVAVLPQFVSYEAGAIPAQLAVLGLIFFAIALVCDSVWALTAGAARSWFARDPKRLSLMGAGGGVMMIGLGGTLALSGNRT